MEYFLMEIFKLYGFGPSGVEWSTIFFSRTGRLVGSFIYSRLIINSKSLGAWNTIVHIPCLSVIIVRERVEMLVLACLPEAIASVLGLQKL